MDLSPQPATTDGEILTDEEVLTSGPQYNEPPKKTRVKWYRCRIAREELAKLNRRSDFLGFAQTLGYLGVLALSTPVVGLLVCRLLRHCAPPRQVPASHAGSSR